MFFNAVSYNSQDEFSFFNKFSNYLITFTEAEKK